MPARAVLSREDGMNVFEVVFAALIMFVVLTAVLGLVATTQQFGVTSKQRNFISNTIASRMEYVRSLPFDQVGVAGSTISGVLQPTESFSKGGFTVDVAYQVNAGDAGTKEVRISVSCGAPGQRTISSTAFSVVRDRNLDVSGYAGLQVLPKLNFVGVTPPKRSIVYDNLVWSPAGSLDIEVEAFPAKVGQKVMSLELYLVREGAGSVILLKSGTTLLSPKAKWEWPEGVASARQTFRWHTKQVDPDPDGNPVPSVAEGWQTIRARAIDSEGRIGTKDYVFFVDNDPPGIAGTPSIQTLSGDQARGNWTAAYDATHYEVRLYRQRADGTAGDYTDIGSWDASATVTIEQLSHAFASVPFSRYVATVLARTQRHSAAAASVSAPTVTTPRLSGTYSVRLEGSLALRRAITTAAVSIGPPMFPVTGVVTYRFFHRHPVQTAGNWVLSGTVTAPGNTTATYTYLDSWQVGTRDTWVPYEYYCEAGFTPAGFGGGASTTVSSNIAGPTAWLATWPEFTKNKPSTPYQSPSAPLGVVSWTAP